MALRDGNGWVDCRCGNRHWGRFGAAGLAILALPAMPDEMPTLLLQFRAAWTHQGSTWGLPGGARFRVWLGKAIQRAALFFLPA